MKILWLVSSTDTATAVTAKISTSDTNVTNITANNQNFGNIAPGQTNSSGLCNVFIQNNPNIISFNVDISSDGLNFWSNSVTVLAGIAENENNIPLEYGLKQNYPNTFNPTTNIEFSIPKSEFATLKVYNIFGRRGGNAGFRKTHLRET